MKIYKLIFPAVLAACLCISIQGKCASFSLSGSWSQSMFYDREIEWYDTHSSSKTTLSATLPMQVGTVDEGTSLSIDFEVDPNGTSSDNAPSLNGFEYSLADDPSWTPGKTSATLVYKEDADEGIPGTKTVVKLSWTKNTLTINLTSNTGLDGVSDTFLMGSDSGTTRFNGTYLMHVQFSTDIDGDPVSYSHQINLKGSNVGTWSHEQVLNSGSFSATGDFTPPGITVVTPKKDTRIAPGQPVLIKGVATSKNGIADVQYSINSDGWTSCESDTLTNWSFTVDAPRPGTNTVMVKAVDYKGNVSPVVTNRFIVTTVNQLQVSVNSAGTLGTTLGTVTGPTNGQAIVAAETYTFTAKPVKGSVLGSWSVYQGDNLVLRVASTPVLKWTNPGFPEGTVVTIKATFVTDPYSRLKGSYTGLFYEGLDGTVAPSTAGSLNLTLNGTGTFSGKVSTMTGTYPFSGQLAYDSEGDSAFVFGGFVIPAAKLSGYLTFTNGLSGVVYNQTLGETVPIQGQLSPTATVSNQWAAPYTFTFDDFSSLSDSEFSGGFGYGTATVAESGSTVMSMVLPDKSATVAVSSCWISTNNPTVPFFQRLYGNKGFVIGWASFSNSEDDASKLVISSDNVLWYKAPYIAGQTTYREGIRASAPMRGLAFQKPNSTLQGTLSISGEAVSDPITADWTYTPAKGFSVANLVNCSQLSLKLTPSSGVVSGTVTFTPDGETKKTFSLSGVAITPNPTTPSFRGFSILGNTSIKLEMNTTPPGE